MFAFQFAYPWVLFIGFPLYFTVLFFKFYFHSGIAYSFPLTHILKKKSFLSGYLKSLVIKIIRSISILLLLFLASRPQWVDVRSTINVDNVDIVLALDVSNSMAISDDTRDPRRRITVVRDEALDFISKRTNDQIGVVVFGGETLSLSPLTMDKAMLKKIVGSLELGVIDPLSTMLGKGLASAVSRLKGSSAKSKIIILLTDGRPTNPNDVPVDKAVRMAQQLGIKVYTIGVGGNNPFIINQFGVASPLPYSETVDADLLKNISNKTGGRYFHAHTPGDVKKIYQVIDSLEKTSQETTMFSLYYECFWPFALILLFFFVFELILTSFLWRSLSW